MKTPETDAALNSGGAVEPQVAAMPAVAPLIARLERVVAVSRKFEELTPALVNTVNQLLAVIRALHLAIEAGSQEEIRAACVLAGETLKQYGEEGAKRAEMSARFATPFGT